MPPSASYIYGEEFRLLSLWCNTLILSSWEVLVVCIWTVSVMWKKNNTIEKICATVINCIIINIYFALIGYFGLWMSVSLCQTSCYKCCGLFQFLRLNLHESSWIPVKDVCLFFPHYKTWNATWPAFQHTS